LIASLAFACVVILRGTPRLCPLRILLRVARLVLFIALLALTLTVLFALTRLVTILLVRHDVFPSTSGQIAVATQCKSCAGSENFQLRCALRNPDDARLESL
jgi:hypothetical protein